MTEEEKKQDMDAPAPATPPETEEGKPEVKQEAEAPVSETTEPGKEKEKEKEKGKGEEKTEVGPKLQKIIDQISKLTVLDLSDLVKALEDKFGVMAAAPVSSASAPVVGGAAAPAEEEKTEFTVVLSAVGEKKIQVIKEVRAVTDLGLKEAKELVEAAPGPVKENINKEEADVIKQKLEAVGATVELK